MYDCCASIFYESLSSKIVFDLGFHFGKGMAPMAEAPKYNISDVRPLIKITEPQKKFAKTLSMIGMTVVHQFSMAHSLLRSFLT